ncbi:MAG: hypothetical protein JRJ19_15320 [Deltaproteobacteria bacterium]|nr:hypothetical protein [Deltaproteobacteria bacterium]
MITPVLRIWIHSLCLLVCLWLAGCSQDEPGLPDAGQDAGADAGQDAGLDAEDGADPADDSGADDAETYDDGDAGMPGDEAADSDGLPDGDDVILGGDGSADDDLVPDGSDDGDAGDGDDWEYERGSLAACLLNPECNRVGITSHMGAWTVTIPGNSMAAYQSAWELGADAIEADVRVSADGVPFMIHNDEITLYESLLCAGKVISESTADEIDDCLLVPSTTETIPTFEEFVEWARGKILIHIDIKESAHIAIMVQQIHAYGAEDFVFPAISVAEATNLLPGIADADSVYFLLRVKNINDIDAALTTLSRPNIFMLEGDRSWDNPPVDEAAMMLQIERVQQAGLRIMASSDKYLATVQNHLDLFAMGFDLILSYNCANGVEAADQVN